MTLPGESQPTRGRWFEDNVAVLDRLSRRLRESVALKHSEAFLEAAIAVINWGGGGSRGNRLRLQSMGEWALQTILDAARQLDPADADTTRLDAVVDMNAGFSKIYSRLIDAFPIYDSRVAAAVCSLVRYHCEESGLPTVPRQLAFGLPLSQGRRPSLRDPSAGQFRFKPLRWGQHQQYAISNLKAAWLLGLLADLGPFGDLSIERRPLALQSALFMIGYATPGPGAIGLWVMDG